MLETPVAEVIAHAHADPAYRAKLKSDPEAVLREAGVEVEDGLPIQVLDTDEYQYLILPPSHSVPPPVQSPFVQASMPTAASQAHDKGVCQYRAYFTYDEWELSADVLKKVQNAGTLVAAAAYLAGLAGGPVTKLMATAVAGYILGEKLLIMATDKGNGIFLRSTPWLGPPVNMIYVPFTR